jgi:hypothetical protein
LYLESKAQAALQTPWTFFSTQHVDEETMKRYELELQNAKQAAQAMKIYLTNLQKTGLAVTQGTEVVARDGYNMSTKQLEELQNLVDDERDRSRRAVNQGRENSRGGRGRSGRASRTTSSSSTLQQALPPIQISDQSCNSNGQPTSQSNIAQRSGRGSGSRSGRVGSRGGGAMVDSSVNISASSSAGNVIY